MKTFIFNKKNYITYQDFYKDLAIKMESVGYQDYYNTNTFDYNPNILWEYMTCEFAYRKKTIKIILIGFDREKISNPKNVDDYEYSLIFQIFDMFIKEFPNNQLEFRMEENKK